MNDLKKELNLLLNSIYRFKTNVTYILRREFRLYWWRNKIYKFIVLNKIRKYLGLSYLDGGWHNNKVKDPFIIKFPIE